MLNSHPLNSYGELYQNNINCANQILKEVGYQIDNIVADEKIHRFGNNKQYWYVCFENWIVAGDWTGGIKSINQALNQNQYNALTLEEKEQVQQKIIEAKKSNEEEKLKRFNDNAIKANDIWKNLSPFGNSLYLKNKKLIAIEGVKFGSDDKGNFIATALVDNFDKIWTLQKIYDQPFENGNNKLFLAGAKQKGCYSEFGNKEALEIFICEGLATGLSILLAKPNSLVVVAYNCHNLQEVARNIKTKYPQKKIIIAGDNDSSKPQNIGKLKAEETVKELGLTCVLPSFKDLSNYPSDFDDLRRLEGLEEIVRQLDKTNNISQENKIKVLPINEFLSLHLEPKEFIIEPIFPKQGLMMIYAKRGIGKTYFALNLACSIAGGFNVFNDKWKINLPRKVLYIDGEMPANTMQERISSLIINLAEIKNPENFQIITPDTQKETCGLIPDLSKEEGQRFIEEIINDKQIDVVVIDNLSTLFRSGRENESESWNPIAQWVLKLRTQGKSIIFIHHAGKNDNQRGTSKKEDILDTVIKLKRPDDYESKEGSRFEVHFEKSRGFAGSDANPFEVKLELTENKANWTIKEIEDFEQKEVLELTKEGLTQRKIAEKLNISPSKVNRILNRIKEKDDDNK